MVTPWDSATKNSGSASYVFVTMREAKRTVGIIA